MKWNVKRVVFRAVFIIVIVLSCITSHAEGNNNLWERLAKREKEFMQLQTDVDIIYKMLAKAFIERYGQEEYENLMWG